MKKKKNNNNKNKNKNNKKNKKKHQKKDDNNKKNKRKRRTIPIITRTTRIARIAIRHYTWTMNLQNHTKWIEGSRAVNL